MDNKQMSIQIIEKMSQFFDMSDVKKQEIFNKLLGFSDTQIDQFAALILSFEKQQQQNKEKFISSLSSIQRKMEEISENKDFEHKIDTFFDNL